MRRLPLIALATALVAACGPRSTTIAHEQGGGATITMGDAGGGRPAMVAKVAGKDATQAPQDLPVWGPAYPGAKVSQVVDMAFPGGAAAGTPQGPHRQVVFETSDSIPKVMAFYDGKLAAAGVKPMMSSNQPDGAMRAIPTPSGQPDTITVGEADGATGIVLTYATRR